MGSAFESVGEFLRMGGYGFFVWWSYGVVSAVLLWQYVAPLRRRKKLLGELADEAEMAAKIKSGRQG